jgi:hypothetical protein
MTTTDTMLVRTADGGWENLQPQTKLPDGGIVEVFGEDIGPVLGAPSPIVVAACSPALPTGAPDALCVDIEGNVTIVTMALTGGAESSLPSLLAFAGSLQGHSYQEFEALCDLARGKEGGLAAWVHKFSPHASFHRGTFEVTVADALSQGRFQLVAIVNSAPAMLTESMRYLNNSGANVACFEASLFSSASVMAVRANAIEVGHKQRAVEIQMSAAGLVAVTERTLDQPTGELMAELQKICSATFDEVRYEGDATSASMVGVVETAAGAADMLRASSDGSVVFSFEAIADMDPGWLVRAELAQAMGRMLGADLGDVKKISQLNLSIREHLMDATLMEALGEILGDTVTNLRAAGEQAAARNGAVRAAA